MQAAADRAWRLAEHPGGVLGVEPGDYPQLYHHGLVPAEPGEERSRALTGQLVQNLLLHRLVAGFRGQGEGKDEELIAETRPGTGRVDSAMPANGEQPGPEILSRAGKALHVPDCLQPGFACHVVDIVATETFQITPQVRVQTRPENAEGTIIARPRALECIIEPISDGHG